MMWGKWRSFIVTLARTVVKSIRHAYRLIQTERFSRGLIAAVDLVGEIYSFTVAMTA